MQPTFDRRSEVRPFSDTTKFLRRKICLLLLLDGKAENGGCGGGDAIAMIGAMANEPEDIAVGGGDDKLAALFEKRGLAVGQEVAHKLMTLHSEGAKCVAGLH